MPDSVFNLVVRVQANVGQALTSLRQLEGASNRAFRNMGGGMAGGAAGGFMAGGIVNSRPFGANGFARGGKAQGPLPFMPGPSNMRDISLQGMGGMQRAATFKDELGKLKSSGYINDIGNQFGNATGKAKGFDKELVQKGKDLKSTGKEAKRFNGVLNQTAGAFALLAGGRALQRMAGSLINPLKQVFKAGMDITATMEDIRARYETLFKMPDGSADIEKVNEMMMQTRVFAIKTPFQVTDLAAGVAQLKGFGIDAFQTIKGINGEMTSFVEMAGDIAATFQMPLSDAVTMLGELRVGAPGAVRRLLTRGIQPLDIREFGIKNGMKGAADFIDAEGKLIGSKIRQNVDDWTNIMGAYMSSRFKGQMERRAATLGGVMSNVKDMVQQILAVGMGGIPQDMQAGMTPDQIVEQMKSSVFGKTKSEMTEVFNQFRHLIGFDLFDAEGKMPQENMAEFQERLRNIRDLFNSLFKPVTMFLHQMVKLLGWLLKMNKEHPRLIRFIALFTSIGFAVLFAASSVIILVGTFKLLTAGLGLHAVAWAGKFAMSIGLTTKALVGFRAALLALGLGLGIVAVIAAIAAAALIWGDDIAAAADKAGTAMHNFRLRLEDDKGVIGQVWRDSSNLGRNSVNEFKAIGAAIASIGPAFREAVGSLGDWFRNLFKNLPGYEMGQNFATSLWEGIKLTFNTEADKLIERIKQIGRIISNVIKAAFNPVGFSLETMAEIMADSKDTTPSNIWGKIKEKFTGKAPVDTKFFDTYMRKFPLKQQMIKDEEAAKQKKHDEKYPATAAANARDAANNSAAREKQNEKSKSESADVAAAKARIAALEKQLSHMRDQQIALANRRGVFDVVMDGKKVGQAVERQRIGDNNRSHGAPVKPQLGYGKL